MYEREIKEFEKQGYSRYFLYLAVENIDKLKGKYGTLIQKSDHDSILRIGHLWGKGGERTYFVIVWVDGIDVGRWVKWQT